MYKELLEIATIEGAKVVRPTRPYQPTYIIGTRNEMHPVFDYINAHDISCESAPCEAESGCGYCIHIGYNVIILTVLP